MKQIQTYKIEQETYDAPFLICVGTEEQMTAFLNLIDPKGDWFAEDDESQGTYYQFTKTSKNMDVRRFIWISTDVMKLPKIDALGIIAHEVLHYTIQTLYDKGLKLTEHSEESYTYLFEYSFKECLKALHLTT